MRVVPRRPSLTSTQVATLADQGVSSFTNFVALAVSAHYLSIASFGWIGISYTCYVLLLGFSRLFAAEILLIRFSGNDVHLHPKKQRDAYESVLGTVAVLSILVGLAVVLGAAIIGGEGGRILALLALLLPGMLLTDAVRYCMFSEGRGQDALRLDLTWLFAQAGALICAVTYADGKSGVAFLTAWGLTGTAAGVVSIVQRRWRPQWRKCGTWLRAHRDLWRGLFGELIGRLSLSQGGILLMGAVVGVSGVAGMRGAELLFGPMRMVMMGIFAIAVPAAVRVSDEPARLMRVGKQVSAALVCGVAAVALLVGLMSDAALSLVVGRSVQPVRAALPAVSLAVMGSGVLTGALVVLRALEQTSEGAWVLALSAATGLVGVWLLGSTIGLRAAAYGLATGSVMAGAAGWYRISRLIRQRSV